jgi:hypothetical protein
MFAARLEQSITCHMTLNYLLIHSAPNTTSTGGDCLHHPFKRLVREIEANGCCKKKKGKEGMKNGRKD